ncbi:hypothetical protein OIV83_004424 [Microbotryomycetes sp. JL201]|nr:hypothetical protein OIV83_004424 [Microbotryomycetes sp. JL201]
MDLVSKLDSVQQLEMLSRITPRPNLSNFENVLLHVLCDYKCKPRGWKPIFVNNTVTSDTRAFVNTALQLVFGFFDCVGIAGKNDGHPDFMSCSAYVEKENLKADVVPWIKERMDAFVDAFEIRLRKLVKYGTPSPQEWVTHDRLRRSVESDITCFCADPTKKYPLTGRQPLNEPTSFMLRPEL